MTLVVDSSALVAIIRREPNYDELVDRLEEDVGSAAMAAPTLLETLIVLSSKAGALASSIEQLIPSLGIETVAFTPDLAQLAHRAFLQFGKGYHPARLNFGDCISYALAKSLDAPLLFKGNDFTQTDIRSAL